MKARLRTIVIAATAALASCSTDSYDTGDGAYSYMRADLVEAHASADMSLDYFVTDDDERLAVANTYSLSWAKNADATYRALLYYNKTENQSGSASAQILRADWVPVLQPDTLEEGETAATDPITFSSAWLSANKKYVNINFAIKTGTADDSEAVQSIGLAYNGTTTLDDGRTCVELLFLHDQGDVPEYYSSSYYASIQTSGIAADVVRIRMNTYNGEAVKEFTLK